MAPRTKTVRLDLTEQLKVIEVLTPHIEVLEPGWHKYHDGWSDEKICAEVPFECTAHNVRSAREAKFGKHAAPEQISQRSMEERIAELQRDVQHLAQGLADLSTKLAGVMNGQEEIRPLRMAVKEQDDRLHHVERKMGTVEQWASRQGNGLPKLVENDRGLFRQGEADVKSGEGANKART